MKNVVTRRFVGTFGGANTCSVLARPAAVCQNIDVSIVEIDVIVRLGAVVLALAITAFVFAREAGTPTMVMGIPLWWIVVPLWAVLLVFLFAIRRTTPKA